MLQQTSEKSCSRCQEIYNTLQDHISDQHHYLSNNDTVLNSVLLNILSLMINKTQPPLPATLVDHFSMSPFQSIHLTPSSASGFLKKNESKESKVCFEKFGTSSGVSLAAQTEILNNHQIINNQISFQQNSLVPLGLTKGKDEQTKINTLNSLGNNSLPESTKNQNFGASSFDFPFLIQPSDLQSTFIAPDGYLTHMGLSLLLGNQAKQSITGKSDHLDIADILVNKMPIPSLNKAFDSSLLSTLYLHQLGVTQHSVGGSEVFNFPNFSNIDEISASHAAQAQNATLHQLLNRHKQISELIESMNDQTKKRTPAKDYCEKSNSFSAFTHPEESSSSISSIPPLMKLEKNILGDNNKLPLSDFGKINENRETVCDKTPMKTLFNLKMQNNQTDILLNSESNEVNASMHSNVSLSSLQSLILETAKEVDEEENKRVELSSSKNCPEKPNYTIIQASTPEKGDIPAESVSNRPKVLYKCRECGVTFSVLATLQNHAKTHTAAAIETCSFCHLEFNNLSDYHQHLVTHRGEDNIFVCQLCTKIFSSKGEFSKHITAHTQRRPYTCSHCQKAFRDPGSLTKHERIHTGELPFVCTVCDRGFAEKSSLRKHLRTHSGEKPYKCDQCPKAFSISGNLQRHMFVHNGERPFKCFNCMKAFNNPSHLRRHIKNLHQKLADKKVHKLTNDVEES